MTLVRKLVVATACIAALGAGQASASAMTPPPQADSDADPNAACEAFVAALPLDDAIMANWDRLGWPLADELTRDPAWAPPAGIGKDIFVSAFLHVFHGDMQRLLPTVVPEVRAALVSDWRDLQTAEDWRLDRALASTPSARKMFLMILADSPVVIATARRAIYPRVTADRDQLYGRVVDAARRYQRLGLSPMPRVRGPELE
jgi:hypothetical protein